MPNLMDNAQYNQAQTPVSTNQDFVQRFNEIRKNPKAFEEQLKRTNPQAYQQALKIRNSQNPQAAIMNMLSQRGLNPNIIRMLGLM